MRIIIMGLFFIAGCTEEPPHASTVMQTEVDVETNATASSSQIRLGSDYVPADQHVILFDEKSQKMHVWRAEEATNRFPGVKPGGAYRIQEDGTVEPLIAP